MKEEEAEPQRQTSQPQEKQEAAAVELTKDTKKDSRRFVFLKFYMHMQTSGKSYIYIYIPSIIRRLGNVRSSKSFCS